MSTIKSPDLAALHMDYVDNRNMIVVGYDRFKAVFNELVYSITVAVIKIFQRMTNQPREYISVDDLSRDFSWKEGSKGLYVCIHGFNGHPSIWRKQHETLRQQEGYDLVLPHIPKKGNCSLEEAADPVYRMVKDYVTKNPQKPVCLLGVSNGARIAIDVERRLRAEAQGTRVKVSLVASATLGTKLVCLAKRLHLDPLFFHPEFAKDLSYYSDRGQSLVKQAQIIYPINPRSYDCYATTEDHNVFPFNACLPNIEGAYHKVINGQGHNSIVSEVSQDQTERCISWMVDNSKEQ